MFDTFEMMKTIATILVYVLPCLVAILLAWTGLSYSKTARQRFRILSYPDGKKHIFLVFIIVLLLLEAACPLYLHFSPATYSARDRIIADQYFMALNVFLVKFRMNLHCLPLSDPIEPEIEEAFHPGVDLLKTGVDLGKIDAELIKRIFTTYDFSKPMVNYKPAAGGHNPTNAEFLTGELLTLNERCVEILAKYTGTGNPSLIQQIELMKNRTDSLLGPFGPGDYSQLSKDNLYSLGEVFELLTTSFDLIDKIRKQSNAQDTSK